MSIRLMSMVMDVDRELLNSTEKLVLLVLTDKANDEGESAYPSQNTMAEKTSLSDRAVRAVLRRLYPDGKHKLSGLVRVKGKSRYDTNDYLIDVKRLEQAVKESAELRRQRALLAPTITPDRNDVPVGGEPRSAHDRNDVPVGGEPRSANPSGIHQLKHQSARVRLTPSGLVKQNSPAPKPWWECEPALTVKRLTKKPVPENRREKIEQAWAACVARGVRDVAAEFAAYHAEFERRGFDNGWWWVEEWLMQGQIPERGARRRVVELPAPETFASLVVR